MKRTEILRSRLLLIGKTYSDLIDELEKYGIKTNSSEISKSYNKTNGGGDKPADIRRLIDEFVKKWEEERG